MGVRIEPNESIISIRQNHHGLPQNLGLSRGKYLRYPVSKIEEIANTANISFLETGAVRFLYFWGVGGKISPDCFDMDCLNMLHAICTQLAKAFQRPVKLTLIMSDLHGKANLFPEKDIFAYLTEIKVLAKSCQFDTVLLSTFFSEDEILSIYDSPDGEELRIYNLHYRQLEVGAAKTGSTETIPQRSLRYLLIRLRERQRIQGLLPNHILLNGDRKENEFLQMEMPMIYIYNTGFKKSHKAWFLSEH